MNLTREPPQSLLADDQAEPTYGLQHVTLALLRRWRLIVLGALGTGVMTLGIVWLVPPTFTARTTLLPPQQQGAASAVLSQLGGLASLAGGIKAPTDQYVALLQSERVGDFIIAQYNLMEVYESKYRMDARKELAGNVRISAGRKDGLITIDVEDHDSQRAANMANSYVTALKRLIADLALTEAQQRRVFFEQQLQKTKEQLTKAQIALQGSGINQGALKAEPKAAAEGYAKLRAETVAARVRLEAMRGMLTDKAPELLQQQNTVTALNRILAQTEQHDDVLHGDSDYISKYREFKYYETLFELFARQYELARVDESRDGTLVQVLDVATPPERKSKPKRALIAAISTLVAAFALCGYVLFKASRQDRSRSVAS